MFGSVSVVSVRGRRAGEPGVVYIGRACAGWPSSVLGNPFVLRRGASLSERRACIRQYRVWLGHQLRAGGPVAAELRRLAALVRAGESVVLGCWCAPLPCHGDVVRSAVLYLAGAEQ